MAGSCAPSNPPPSAFFKPSTLAIRKKHHIITMFALGEGRCVPNPTTFFFVSSSMLAIKKKASCRHHVCNEGRLCGSSCSQMGRHLPLSTFFTIHEDRRVQQKRQATTVTKIASPTPAVIVTVDTFSNSMTVTRTRPRPPRSL